MHAALMMDRVRWHATDKPVVPANIDILTQPPRSSELNPVDNVRQFTRDNCLSSRMFRSRNQIIAKCSHACTRLINYY